MVCEQQIKIQQENGESPVKVRPEGGEKQVDLKGECIKVRCVKSYEQLDDLPQINNVTLKGNKSFEELGDNNLTNQEIKAIFDRVFNN